MRAIVFSAVRLFVVFSVVRLIGAIPSIFSSAMTLSGSSVRPDYLFRVDVPYFLVWLLYAAVLALIWFKAEAVAEAVVGRHHEAEFSGGSLERRDLLEVGSILLGLFLIVDSIPALFNHLGFFVEMRLRHLPPDLEARTTSREEIGLLGVVLKMALAGFLIAKRSSIGGMADHGKNTQRDRPSGE